MKIKTKLNIGVGLLFMMILGLSILSGWYINQLKKDTNNILKANYNTLQYSRNMLLALEEINTDPLAFSTFEKDLSKQKQNVTETGERETTESILNHFEALKKDNKSLILQSLIRKDIAELMQLNMGAIEEKSSIADATAKNAIAVVSVTGLLCFLIAFIVMVNLPSNIADPIQSLTESIKQIANQNYRERVHFESRSEFGELAKSFNTMAEKLQEYSETKLDKIIRGKRRIETLIDNMHDPIIGIDEHKKVLFVNDEALKISGLKKERFVGRSIQDIAVTNDLIRDLIRDMMEDDSKKINTEPLKIFADGKESYFEKEIIDINVTPTGELQSHFIGQVLLLRNITPFKELDLAKTNFLGTVSHEFKTPISSIQMGVQLLENRQIGNLNSEQEQLVYGIKEDSNRLLSITKELLNITQIESGSIQLNIKPSFIHAIIEEAMNANTSVADQKNIEFKVDIQEGLTKVFADQEKTYWVLNNLISNALRYSFEDSFIHITVADENPYVRFSVIDFGLGIEHEYLEKIFERYFRIPESKKEGTGLGLSISKEFIEAQGGEISVKSELGVGSTFSFILKKASVL